MLAKILSRFYELQSEWSQLLTGESFHIMNNDLYCLCPRRISPSFNFFFFLPFLKIVYIYLYKLAILWSLLDLSSMTRDQTHVPCREAHSPNHLDHEGIPWPHHLKSTQESLWASCTKRKQIYLSYFCIFLMFYNILTSTSAPNSSHCQLSASDLVIS